ncbi:flagellar motor protein MotB [Flavobacterium sp. RSP49]|uniref:OmpA family protein n=1 Tax=Flavobacterium sp. RSP49 TaxID=2497487 RepID=UPI000F84CFDF|nr:OmpA family protein [Flavobacterium sp. RSP49]RTZ03541.1 flagellar motor protein MotB [Flavobacterium sp. RSP49]
MKKNSIYILLMIVSLNGYSQKMALEKAEKEYENFAYVDAIKTYERLFDKGYKTADMLQKLGNSFYFNAELESAAKWYGELFVLTENVAPEYYYRYAQSLKSKKEYAKADAMMTKFNQLNGNDTRAKLAASQKDYLLIIKKNSGRYTMQNAGINSEYSDYGSSFFGDKIVFGSARFKNGLVNRKYSWTGEGYTNLYQSDKNPDGTLTGAKLFSKKLNSKFHESTAVFTKDGQTVYFTRNNFLNHKVGENTNKTTLLKIYKASFVANEWTAITELPFNDANYSVAHPALSPDEKTLYFSSDMPGTLGQSDLFKVSINEDDTFGTPINLGKEINTEGRETFPFLTADNELYFASDGYPGLGGLDIFVAKASKEGVFKNVLNVGEPLNSPQDDFSLIIDTSTKIGYVTSNRAGGQGGDDIYMLKEIKKIEYPCEQFLVVAVSDKETGSPIAGAKVSLSDSNYKLGKEIITNAEGYFDFGQVDCEAIFYIKIVKTEYNTDEVTVNVAKDNGKTIVPIVLEKTIKKLKAGDDLAKALNIKMIYFDLDKFTVRPDAMLELSKILDVMEQNPNMKIDIRSHTDSRQSHSYNQKLSERRAQSSMEWLIKNGIHPSRLTAEGYGENQLINICADGIICTELEHQTNRRSEFILVK